jgi:hypothetical protein
VVRPDPRRRRGWVDPPPAQEGEFHEHGTAGRIAVRA